LYFFWLPFWLSVLLGLKNPYFFIIPCIEIVWKLEYIRNYRGMIWLRHTSRT
jgi:hypothetical protein